jgi:hypothetical protein
MRANFGVGVSLEILILSLLKDEDFGPTLDRGSDLIGFFLSFAPHLA